MNKACLAGCGVLAVSLLVFACDDDGDAVGDQGRDGAGAAGDFGASGRGGTDSNAGGSRGDGDGHSGNGTQGGAPSDGGSNAVGDAGAGGVPGGGGAQAVGGEAGAGGAAAGHGGSNTGATSGAGGDNGGAGGDSGGAGGDNGGAGGDNGGAGGGGNDPECTAVEPSSAWLFSTTTSASSVVYQAFLSPNLGVPNFGNVFDFLQLMFWGQDSGLPGSYTLGQGADATFATCEHCFFAIADASSDDMREFFAASGTLVLEDSDVFSGVINASVSDVTFREVVYDDVVEDYVFVPNGLCVHLESAAIVVEPE